MLSLTSSCVCSIPARVIGPTPKSLILIVVVAVPVTVVPLKLAVTSKVTGLVTLWAVRLPVTLKD